MFGLDSEDRLLGPQDYLLLAAILLLPWAWGGMETWSYRCAAFLVVAAGCFALASEGLAGWGLSWKNARWLLPAALLAAWAAIQLVPLPPAVLRTVSPQTHRVYTTVLPAYPASVTAGSVLPSMEEKALARVPEANGVSGPAEPAASLVADRGICRSNLRPISLHPDATLERLFWFLALLLAFLLVSRRCADPDVMALYRAALFALFSTLALVIVMRATSINFFDRLLAALEGIRFGLYGNANHRAGVMELAVPWLAGHAWLQLRREGRAALVQARFLLCAGGAGACLAACLLSASKMGALLVVLSLTALALLGARTLRWRLVAAGSCLLLAGGGALLLAQSQLGERIGSHLGRLQEIELGGKRPTAWQACTEMLWDYPLTGSGFGAFREVFAHYLPPGEYERWAQAHNDYLEVVLGGGLLAALLLVWLIGAYGFRLARAAKSSIAAAGPSWIGLVLGSASLAVHAFVDFNHQMPATALLFVTLCAMALPMERSARSAARSDGRLALRRTSLLLASALLLSVYGYRAFSAVVARTSLTRGVGLDHAAQEAEGLPLIERAKVGVDRIDSLRRLIDVRLELYDRLAEQGSSDSRLLSDAAADSMEYLCRCPAAWRPWSGLGRIYGRVEAARLMAQGEQALGGSWADVSRAGRVSIGMYRIAIERAKHWYENYDRLAIALGSYGLEPEALSVVEESARVMPLYWRHRYIGDERPPPAFREAFSAGAWGALGHTPFLTRMEHLIALGRLETMWGDPERAIQALEAALREIGDTQDRAEANYLLGEALRQAGQFERAQAHFELALPHKLFEEAAVGGLAEMALDLGQTERALELLQRLRWMDPTDLDLCLKYAAVATKLGNWPAALEALKWAGVVDSQDPRPRVALIETYIAMDDVSAALTELSALEKEGNALEEVERLREIIASRSAAQSRSNSTRSEL